MKKMGVKLGDLKRFLADADRRNISDESVQEWVKELKGTMYASDILDLCHRKAMKRGPSRDMGCFNTLLFCLRNPLHAHDMGSRLKKLNEKLIDIEKSSKTFDFHLTSYEDNGIRNIESSHLARRETTGELDKLDLVGDKVVEDTRNLVELLTREEKTIHEHNKVMVFAIVGVGGIGKTTLAKSIFNNEIIQQKFNEKIWLSVNQD
jgi:flagellar biosynthesis GTPase FlhF